MKRLVAITLVALMLCTLCLPVFAASGESSDGNVGSITINNATIGQTYTIYKMLELESFTTDKAYSYKISTTDPWYEFFNTYTYTLDGKKLFAIDESGYVTTTNASTLTGQEKADLATAALAYAANKGIEKTEEITATTNLIEFTGLELGYYLVESTVGTLCGLTTTEPAGTINAKNTPPTIEKQVKEDSNGSWGSTNDESFYKDIEFRIKINVKAGAEHYVLHDIMDVGLDLVPGTIKVYLNNEGITELENTKYTINENVEATHGAEYRNAEQRETKCAFEIDFAQEFLNTILPEGNDVIWVYYKARLNDQAVVGGASESTGNINKTWLDYGAGSYTEYSSTTTYTYEFDLVKTDDKDNLLDGAIFHIYNDNALQKPLPIKLNEETGNYEIIAFPGTEGVDVAPEVDIVVTNGKVTIVGLDGDTIYYLKETQAPKGYNILPSAESIQILKESKKAEVTHSPASDPRGLGVYVSGGIQIENKTGTVLPNTGGLGTAIFVAVGSVLVLGTGIVLVSKMRMSKYTD